MKLATLRNGLRDGQPVVVDRALARCVAVSDVVPSLQRALEDWDRFAPALAEGARALEAGGRVDARPFEAAACAAPLPRAYQFVDGSAYVNHVELLRKARGAESAQAR